jgi:hypothetical protein
LARIKPQSFLSGSVPQEGTQQQQNQAENLIKHILLVQIVQIPKNKITVL